MKKRLLVTRKNNFIFSALTDEQNNLIEVSVDSLKEENLIDNIYIGQVNNVLPNIHASFVEFRKGQNGFIPDILKNGEKVMVQVVKESIKGKEPVLSRTPVITGKYVILTTKIVGIHFSYKFKDADKKKEITALFDSVRINDCGFIVRTKALYVDNALIMHELMHLYNSYMDMKKDAVSKKLYSQLYRSLPSHLLYLQNSRQNEFLSIVTDDERLYDDLKDYLEIHQPEDLPLLGFYDAKEKRIPISVIYNLKKQLHEIFSEKVYLKSGGHLVIQHTEALNVIDVNSASDVSGKSSPEEYLKINLEAAQEAARQIRLRNISGIILIDFINMSNLQTKMQLLEALKKYLDQDPMGPNVVDMTKLGIVEITRKRAKKPLAEVINEHFFD